MRSARGNKIHTEFLPITNSVQLKTKRGWRKPPSFFIGLLALSGATDSRCVHFGWVMLAAARLRHVAGSKWGTRRYMDMNRLADASEAA
jgi:hypothetical protein